MLSDHKPLESIMKKDLLKCPKHLQNMLMQLQKYDVIDLHLIDTQNRAYIHKVTSDSNDDGIQKIVYIPVIERRLLELLVATKTDKTVMLCSNENKPDHSNR